MKLLKSVKLVQFFLFESAELSFDEITGIFGRNGGGKSSLLDALQIAMLGANSNLTALNAQADEHTTRLSRSLRAYCLGQHSPEQRVRDEATTYITLIWHDTETNEQLSMGVCIGASADNESHTVLGRYVLRGTELAMADHLESVEGKPRPRSWKEFRHHLQERAHITGEDPCFEDSKRYVLAALTALRGGGGTPFFESYTRAFRFALRMRFDKDVDYIIRNDVLEARPTNVRKFRDLVDTFSKLNNIVKMVEETVNAGAKVVEAYSNVLTETRREATWQGLAASTQHTIHAEEFDQLTVKYEQAIQTLEQCQQQAAAAAHTVQELEQEQVHQQALQVAHAAHQDHAQVQAARIEAENRVRGRRAALVHSLSEMQRQLSSGATSKELVQFRAELQAAAGEIATLLEAPDSVSSQDAGQAVRRASKLAAAVSEHLAEMQRTITTQLTEMGAKIQDMSSSLDRVRSGRPPLNPPVQRLLTEFSHNGLTPTPVCDLVRITDPDWQPAIEAYLGRNVEALLVSESDEKRAFQIYREMNGARTVYGVKIAMASRQKNRERPAVGSVAELIEGDSPAAVAYLRGLFGDVRCATESGDALSGGRTLTKDGMLVGRGEFERLKLAPAHELKIGAGGTGQVDNLAAALKGLVAQRGQLKTTKGVIDGLYRGLLMVANDSAVQLIDQGIGNLREALNDHEAANARAAKSSDAGYQAICQRIADLVGLISDARAKQRSMDAEVVRADGTLKTEFGNKESAAAALTALTAQLESLRANPDYDKLYASEQWDKLLSQFDSDYPHILVKCQEQAAACRTKVSNLLSKASNFFGTYLSAPNRGAPGQEVLDDWRLSMAWMEAEIKRLHDTELLEHKEQADAAYQAAQETFRTDVAIALSNSLDALDDNFTRLNNALRDCPSFSNGERYQFVRNPRPDLKPLMTFVQDVAANGAHRDLLDDAGEIPPEFAALLQEKVAPGAAGIRSVLDDYREFFQFDIRIDREDPVTKELKQLGMLSKRLGPGSGGEHRAPLYVIAGAALASAYRMDKKNRDGLGLILLDEAFDKMDMTNIVATMQYLEQLGLQIVMASPGENQGTLNAFLRSYYDVQRDTDYNVIHLEKHTVSEIMRQMYREDLPEFNPELLTQELAALRGAGVPVTGA